MTRYFVAILVCIGSLCAAECIPSKQIGQTHLSCESSSSTEGTTIRWKITKPEVTRQLTEYRDITFEPGDQVLVSARGCVDVSPDPNRHDWRRYVDPEGSNTDRNFHGLIWIPGASIRDNSQLLAMPAGTGPVRISSVAGSNAEPSNVELLSIQEPPRGTLPTLRLGYEVD